VGITRQSNPPFRMSNSKLPFVIRLEPGMRRCICDGNRWAKATRSPTIVPAPCVESAHRNREGSRQSQAHWKSGSCPPADARAFPYFDAADSTQGAGTIVGDLVRLGQRFPSQIQRLIPGSSLITNGSFEFDILNGDLMACYAHGWGSCRPGFRRSF